jgi:hypothetical protein
MDKKIFKNRKNQLQPETTFCTNCNAPHTKSNYYWRCRECDDKYILCDKCYKKNIYYNHDCTKIEDTNDIHDDICGGFMLSESSGRSV